MKMPVICSFLLLCFSCQSYKVTRVTEDNRQDIDGLRFFLPKPYLMVAEKDLLVDGVQKVEESEGKKRIVTTQKMAVPRRELKCFITYLPDPEKEYAITTLFGRKPTGFTLEDGWRLSGLNLSAGNSPVVEASGFLNGTQGLEPGFYEILYENGATSLKKVEIIK